MSSKAVQVVSLALVLVVALITGVSAAQQCDLDIVSVQSNFDIKRFLGVWYEMERTELQWGQRTWHSTVWRMFQATNGTYFFSYTGYSSDTGCSKPETGFFNDTQLNGRLMMTSEEGNYFLMYQVAYTDYNHVALVYMCYEPLTSGGCHKNKLHVSFLSRDDSQTLTSHQRSLLVSHLEQNCLHEGEMVQATTGLCIDPTPDPILVG